MSRTLLKNNNSQLMISKVMITIKEFLESLRDKCDELSRENLQLRLKLRVGQESIR